MPSSTSHSPPTVTAVAAVAAVLLAVVAALLAAGGRAPAAGTVPSRVLPPPAAADGTDVTLRPTVLRSDEGRATVEVALGTDAPGDVTVELALTAPQVSRDGVVTAGEPAPTGRITRGGRLAPGEALQAEVDDVTVPLVVVATVRAAEATTGTDGATSRAPAAEADGVELAAVVLPGPVGPPPTASIELVDDEVRATIAAEAPVLVTARLDGARTVTHPTRLVLPDQSVVLTGAPARWPVPTQVAITDEAGRSTVVATDQTALAVVAVLFVLAAATGTVVVVRRRRGADHR